jgi:hypothetical protein
LAAQARGAWFRSNLVLKRTREPGFLAAAASFPLLTSFSQALFDDVHEDGDAEQAELVIAITLVRAGLTGSACQAVVRY